MAPNSGDSSASSFKSFLNGGSLPTDTFLHRLPYRHDLVAPIVYLTSPRHAQTIPFISYEYPLLRERVFRAVPYSGRLILLIKNLLPSNGRRSVVCFAAVARNERVSKPFAKNGCFSGCTVFALSKYATICTMEKTRTSQVYIVTTVLSVVKLLICREIEVYFCQVIFVSPCYFLLHSWHTSGPPLWSSGQSS
jgi:hypothetical protein